jgi:hypothetical protein
MISKIINYNKNMIYKNNFRNFNKRILNNLIYDYLIMIFIKKHIYYLKITYYIYYLKITKNIYS